MGASSEDIKNQMVDWVVSEIYSAQEIGVAVAVDGEVYSVQETDRLHSVMEDNYYMKSYESDARGKIVRIDFNHI